MNASGKTGFSLMEKAEAFSMRYLEYVPDSILSRDLLCAVSVSVAREETVLPVVLDGVESLLLCEPDNLELLHRISLLAGRHLEPVAAPRDAILEAIDRACAGAISAAESPAESSPAIAAVDRILSDAALQKASDIHFEPSPAGLSVRFRIDGRLYPRQYAIRGMENAVISRLKVMAAMDIAEKRLPQDGMAEVKIGQKTVDLRLSTVPVSDGERLVLRILDRDGALSPLESLGMSGDTLSRFESLISLPNGIIVVSGPTGSGKTTTLYSALGRLDSASRNILTIEDPVEYRLPEIGQIQVRPKIGLTFANGLRHILRQDPDVILVGETRDPETAQIAVRASLTGHLVFTTLHTNDAPSAVMRLADMGVPPYLVASSLRGVLAQRLVRVLCPECSSEAVFSPGESRLPQLWKERLCGMKVRTPAGCHACMGGYRGRKGIFELMAVDAELASVIRGGILDGADIREAAIRGGMVPMFEDGLEKVLSGVTDAEEIAGALAV